MIYFENQTQEGEQKPTSGDYAKIAEGSSGTGYACKRNTTDQKQDYPRCNRPENVYINDVFLHHQNAKSKITSNEYWFFDYAANRIYMRPPAAGAKIETSVASKFIEGWGNFKNVTVSNLVIEKFATPLQQATVENYGEGGVIEFTEIRWNHGGGAGIGKNGIMRNSYVHNNGQKGLTGTGYTFTRSPSTENGIFEKNEIAYNNIAAGAEETWESGGSKWAYSKNLIVRNNYSHHNLGPGFWTDIDNIGCLYEGNIVEHNTKHGIQHELSFDCEFRNNYLAYNKKSQLAIQNSMSLQSLDAVRNPTQHNNKYILAHNNIIIVGQSNETGVSVEVQNRGLSNIYWLGQCDRSKKSSSTCHPWTTKYVKVYNNNMYSLRTSESGGKYIAALWGRDRSVSPDPYNVESAAPWVQFYGNRYFVSNPNLKHWGWGKYWTGVNYDGFKKLHPNEGPVSTNTTLPARPVWNHPVGPQ